MKFEIGYSNLKICMMNPKWKIQLQFFLASGYPLTVSTNMFAWSNSNCVFLFKPRLHIPDHKQQFIPGNFNAVLFFIHIPL
jgi:hypothetical protein